MGQACNYWLGDSDLFDKTLKEFLFSYLEHYQGPHRVMIFSSSIPYKDPRDTCLTIDLDCRIDKTVYQLLLQKIAHVGDMVFVHDLFTRIDDISLDQACLLMYYHHCVGRRSSDFFTHWFDKLVVPEQSLFYLSQQLFAKNSSLFLRQWQLIKDNYAAEFWPVFLSEQLWQATWFVTMMRDNQKQAASAYGKRLPFSFIQRDWQRYASTKELMNAHASLYQLDYTMKNGGSFELIELFFLQFMHNYFII